MKRVVCLLILLIMVLLWAQAGMDLMEKELKNCKDGFRLAIVLLPTAFVFAYLGEMSD
jgi:hypothetical protein